MNPREWRTYAAFVAHFLSTPIPVVMQMYFDDVINWYAEGCVIRTALMTTTGAYDA